jgi:hypothetical protein
MKSMFLLLIPALLTFNADFGEVEQRVKEKNTYSALIHSIKDQLAYTKGDETIFYPTISRNIGFDHQQERLSFATEEFGPHFHLSIVKKNEQLLYAELSLGKRSSRIVYSESGINAYLTAFNKTFGTTKNITDFEKEIDKVPLFSNACGFSGDPTPEWQDLERYMAQKRVDKIRAFLTSLNVEAQAYGLIGMLQLQKNGIKLSQSDLSILDHLTKQNSSVYTCMGCIVGEIVSINDLLGWYVK